MALSIGRGTAFTPVLLQKPNNWPTLHLISSRIMVYGAIVNLARVRWTNDVTGNTAELDFTGYSTTLQGARQQRRLPACLAASSGRLRSDPADPGGWARFYGTDDPANDDTLDTLTIRAPTP